MMWKSHLIGGTAFGCVGATITARIARNEEWIPLPQDLPFGAERYLITARAWVSETTAQIVDTMFADKGPMLSVYIAIALILFWVGCLLPDIDNPKAKFGIQGFPGPHRGITHSDFFPIVLSIPAAVFPSLSIFSFLVFGVCTHLYFDEFSAAGRVRFYPFSRYYKIITYEDGTTCVVSTKRSSMAKHKVGSFAETIIVAVHVIIAMIVLYLYFL